jgi:hypothetical protein
MIKLDDVIDPEMIKVALRMTPPKVQVGTWGPDGERVCTSDEELAFDLRVPIVRRKGKRGGWRLPSKYDVPVNVVQEYVWARTSMNPTVTELTLRGGREVFAHSLLDRLMQRAMLEVVGKHADRLMPNSSSAYRPGRSHKTALGDVKKAVRSGSAFAVNIDLKGFFPSVSTDLLNEVLPQAMPWADSQLIKTLVATSKCSIVRAARNESTEDARTSNHLLQGSVLAPLLANVIADHLIGHPFNTRFGSEVLMLRFSDDMLLLSRSPQLLSKSLQFVESCLAGTPLRLHPDKGVRIPTDVRINRILWCGKLLHGSRLLTPPEKLKKLRTRLVNAISKPGQFRMMARVLLDELEDDPKRTWLEVFRAIQDECPQAEATLRALAVHRAPARAGWLR